MKIKIQACFIFFFYCTLFCIAQKNCSVNNQTFKSNEQLNYKIYYNWGAIWMAAGEASFNTYKTKIRELETYHFVGLGATYPKYDWFYKVRDKYESYVDTATLKPIRFTRECYEGSNYTFDDYVFTQKTNKVYTSSKRDKKNSKIDSIKVTNCTNDVLTAIYHARCLDFSIYKPNDTIPIVFVLDGEVFPSYIRYLGKEVIKSELLGTVRCIKFKPKLIEGTIFKEGEGMTVWVTDDKNKLPVYVETPLTIGTIKVMLTSYTNLRNPMDGVIKSKAP